jgi:hypothetical protein
MYESDGEIEDCGVADVLTPYVDKRPCNSAKMALDILSYAPMFDFLNNYEDWPTVFYNTTNDGDAMHRYNYEVDYRGDLTYKELCKQEYDAYMLRICTPHALIELNHDGFLLDGDALQCVACEPLTS